MKTIVVKIGSNVLTRNDGSLDGTRMSAIVDQVAAIRKRGDRVVLVSSCLLYTSDAADER